MSTFLEKHARHLSADELRDYVHLEVTPQIVRDCVASFDEDRLIKEGELEEERAEEDDRNKEELQEQFNELRDGLLEASRTASYEELEEQIKTCLSRFRMMKLLKEE